MMEGVSVITGKAVPLKINIGTTDKDTIEATAQGETVIKLSGVEKPVTLNRVVHISYAEHSSVSLSALCNDNHTLEFTSWR